LTRFPALIPWGSTENMQRSLKMTCVGMVEE